LHRIKEMKSDENYRSFEKKEDKSIMNRSKSYKNNQIVVIHQYDCIYQGYVNSSYQREGFGMQQT
jgi:hypothetical protein